MTRRDLLKYDASESANSELEYIIKRNTHTVEPKVPTITAAQAIADKKMLDVKSNREVTRVLFISRDSELLNPAHQTLDGYIDVSDLFDEVHILILRQGIAPKNPVLRVSDNVWLYTATHKTWWKTPSAAMEMAENQLVFANGFRPDLIVARDPFESAWVANKLGTKYNRPTQLHVLEDYSTDEFFASDKDNYWRLKMPFFTVSKFNTIRTSTDSIKNMMLKKHHVSDVKTLPRYQNYEALINKKTELVLKDKYKPMIFFLVYVGRLDEKSNLRVAMDAAVDVLKNRRLGLIVIGDGPERSGFERRAKILGIDSQVIFERKVEDIVPYLKDANILLVSDTDFESEEIVLKGAASGVPMVMSSTEKREDIFREGESAFLCEKDSVVLFKQRIDELLNSVGLRHQFTMNAQDIIKERFYNDPSEYLSAYRASIEEAFFVEPMSPESES